MKYKKTTSYKNGKQKDPPKKQDPILVYDKNDPRLRAYNDSLSLYNLEQNHYLK